MYIFQRVIFVNAIKFVSTVSCDQHSTLILVVEGALGYTHLAADSSNCLLDEALCLIPGPENDSDIWLSSQCDE